MLHFLTLSTDPRSILIKDALHALISSIKAPLYRNVKKTLISCVNNLHLHARRIHFRFITQTRTLQNVVLGSCTLDKANNITVSDSDLTVGYYVAGRSQLLDTKGSYLMYGWSTVQKTTAVSHM
jgi:hypothetical protein